jgi:23S rRNA pseudouridine955/2504/2580 synthase
MKNVMISATVTFEDDGIRLDRWFKRHHKDLSFGPVVKNVRKGLIRVNDKKIDISDKISTGDVISYPDFLDQQDKDKFIDKSIDTRINKPSLKNIKLITDNIIYKDESIIVLNKPAGLAVQGGTKVVDSVDSLSEGLKFDCDEKPKLVHRLDKETSGILILARKTYIAAKFSEVFRSKAIKKTYIAIVNGVPKTRSGKIDIPIEKIKNRNNFEKVVESVAGKKSITYYEVLDHATDKYALLKLDLLTGRTHQIRTHLSSIDCPIIGDGKYGRRASIGGLIENKLYLHAYKISFCLEGKNYDFTAPPPPHFKNALSNLGLVCLL